MSRSARLAVAIATMAATCVLVPAALAATGPYVALGDSYTAAPLVPNPTGSPLLCGRSTHNYPQDVRHAIGPSSFTDASCSSATTADMTQSQSLEGGLQTAPPQFDALKPNDALVTLGIGGNDAGLISVAEECAKLDAVWPFGTSCKNHYNSGGTDTAMAAVNAAGPKVAAVIQGIHARAASAEVLAVGYPDGLPVSGGGCWPVVPFSSGDVSWFNSLETRLNAVIKISRPEQRRDVRGHVQLKRRPRRLRRILGLGQRHHSHLPGLPAASQSGRGDQHGQSGPGRPVIRDRLRPPRMKEHHGT